MVIRSSVITKSTSRYSLLCSSVELPLDPHHRTRLFCPSLKLKSDFNFGQSFTKLALVSFPASQIERVAVNARQTVPTPNILRSLIHPGTCPGITTEDSRSRKSRRPESRRHSRCRHLGLHLRTSLLFRSHGQKRRIRINARTRRISTAHHGRGFFGSDAYREPCHAYRTTRDCSAGWTIERVGDDHRHCCIRRQLDLERHQDAHSPSRHSAVDLSRNEGTDSRSINVERGGRCRLRPRHHGAPGRK